MAITQAKMVIKKVVGHKKVITRDIKRLIYFNEKISNALNRMQIKNKTVRLTFCF
jgi:hypothetical protein